MLTVFKKFVSQIKYVWRCICANIKSSLSNKKSFIIQTVAMFINNSVFILFWGVLLNNKGGNVNGVDIKSILYLWSIPTMGFGITFFCFGGINNLCKDIANGNLDIYLTKPKHSLISELTSDSVLSAMGDFLFGMVCGIIAIGFNPIKFVYMLLLSILSSVILTCVVTSINLLSFWVGDVTSVANRYVHSLLITLTIYPEQMFPVAIKVMMYTLIPAMYVAHIPVKLMIAFNMHSLLLLIVVTILSICLMLVMYNKGLRKYESGNGVTRR